jgi:hypothetical protein
VPELDRELEDLFARPLAEFTQARNELARRLRKAGQEEAAARVQGLKKPSVPVWAVNQLARKYPDDVRELVDAGARLRKAQQAAFRGGGTDAVREATVAERSAARMLTRLAHEVIAGEGRPATRAVTERIGSLLRSAAIDPEAAQLLAAGRLTEEVESTGFGAVAGIAPPRPAPAKPRPKADVERQRRQQKRRRLEAQVERLRRAAAEADAKAERAERAADKARADAAAAHDALAAAEAELQAENSPLNGGAAERMRNDD